MNGAQITWIVIHAIALSSALEKHGEYKVEKNNFWVTAIAIAIDYALLKWGGFF